MDELRSQGFKISDEDLKSALSQVKKLTGLHGRWETLSEHPLTICDTGHNPEGIKEVLENIALVHSIFLAQVLQKSWKSGRGNQPKTVNSRAGNVRSERITARE